jgi:hypothetical protein
MDQKAIKYGVVGGLISVAISLIIYLINPMLFAEWWVGLIGLPISIAILLALCFEIRKENGGFLKFGDAFLNMLIAGVIMTALSVLFTIVLFNVIDPELPAVLTDQVLQNTAEMMSNFGMPEAQLEEAMQQTAEGMESAYSVGKLLLGIIWGAVWYAVLSLILGLIVKRNPPEEA